MTGRTMRSDTIHMPSKIAAIANTIELVRLARSGNGDMMAATAEFVDVEEEHYFTHYMSRYPLL